MTGYHHIPKIELHVHLEGAIPLDALWQLIEKYNGDKDGMTRSKLNERFAYRDFPHFIDTWIWKNRFLREYEDFTFIAEAVAGDFLRQNIIYAEFFHSPADFHRHGLETPRLVEAVRKGFDKVKELKTGLVIDLVRDFGPEKGRRTLSEILEVQNAGIVGITIGGSEQAFPPEPFGTVFEEARKAGLNTSAHAGEAAGPESVWGAIRTLKVDRIGHGTRAVEDTRLMDYLAEHQIAVEMCPLSNVRTAVVPGIEAHPIREFYQRGIPLSINTDDPKMFGNSLVDEYQALEQSLGFTLAEIMEIIRNSVDSAFISEAEKAAVKNRLNAGPGI